MPLYDFECKDCGYIEEILTKSAGNTEIVLTCPDCEKETMKRKIGLSAFHLKGGGWYKDGYSKRRGLNKTEIKEFIPEASRKSAPEGTNWFKIPAKPFPKKPEKSSSKNNDKKK